MKQFLNLASSQINSSILSHATRLVKNYHAQTLRCPENKCKVLFLAQEGLE